MSLLNFVPPYEVSDLVQKIVESVAPAALTALLILVASSAGKLNGNSGGIVDKLVKDLSEATQKENECAKNIEILTHRIEALEREKNSLTAKIDALFDIIRKSDISGGRVDDTELGRMRRWMFQHLDEESLMVVCADSGLSKPRGESLDAQILSVVEEARRMNLVHKLAAALIARVPNAPAW